MIWTIHLGGRPAVKIEAEDIHAAAASFVEDNHPGLIGCRMIAHHKRGILRVEIGHERFAVTAYRRVAT